MSWFLKYRPHQIADLDLTEVREHFLQLMDHGQFPQTLLFAGPKGTGKTSASRIIGAMLNDPANEKTVQALFFDKKKSDKLSLKEPDPQLDFSKRVFKGQSFVVQEIDAASHRGIDHIRQLKERIFLPPQEGIMAVYILDEVHMLTNEAFNALLKILEEPPPHAVFILATTELHKVPATIVSRCNLVSFRKASLQEMINRLKKILKQEKVKFEEEALLEIARRSDGSFRDAVKLAEIASQNKNITLEAIDKLIGGSAMVEVKKLIKLILDKDAIKISQFFNSLRERNFDQEYFYQSLFTYLHQSLLGSLGAIDAKPQLEQKISLFLLNQLTSLDLNQACPIDFLPLELRLLMLIDKAKAGGKSGEGDDGVKPKKREKQAVKKVKAEKSKMSDVKTSEITEASSDQGLKPEILTAMPINGESLSQCLCSRWEDFLKMVEKNNSTLAALLRSSRPKAGENGIAEVMVFYRFHQEQLQLPRFKSIIENCGEQVVGDKIQFKFVLTEPETNAELVDVPAQTDSLEALAEEALM
jgi:DNA polymerase III subunit gamma/tau